jgi:acyl-CoA synthetase (NDP forming)
VSIDIDERSGQQAAAGEADAAGLAALFSPRAIALVGATDKSGWSVNTLANLRQFGFPGAVHLVNPKGGTVHGEPAYRSLAEIPGPVDLAYVMVPTPAVLGVLREGADRGIRSYVVLTAGFGETGAEGLRLEQEVVAFARERGLTVLGPNGNGYINAAAGITPYGLPIPPPLKRGSVGIVLQSGALASSVLAFAQARNLGISLLTSMGNEALVSVTDVMEYLVDDPDTKVIALFLESVRHSEHFVRVARRALAAGKPVVALKIGRSQLASHTAQAHTGALVGDDDVIEAAFGQLGVVRVRSLEDLIITAGVLAEVGPLPGPRIGVVTPSGGASEIIADRAEDEALELPPFAPETQARLAELLPPFATVANPLDVTGYVVVDRTLLGRALAIAAQDPGLDALLLLSDPPRVRPPDPALALSVYAASADVIAASPLPVVVVSNVLTDISEFGRTVQQETGYPYVAGSIEHGVTAISHAVRWGAAYRRALAQGFPAWPEPAGPAPVPGEGPSVWAEHRAAALLAEHGVPVVPGELVDDADQAVAAAERLGWPVVLKAAVEGLGHKSDVGGVRLDLRTPEELRDAHATMLRALESRGMPGARALVQPQRPAGGVELLVGVVRDASWGLTLALGLGGVWVETLRDSALRLLPVDAADVRQMLRELRGARLLEGVRGTEPADLDRLTDVVVGIATLACRLGDRLDSLEVNPLLVRGSQIEALDALVTWRA